MAVVFGAFLIKLLTRYSGSLQQMLAQHCRLVARFRQQGWTRNQHQIAQLWCLELSLLNCSPDTLALYRKIKTVGENKEGGVPDGMALDQEGRIWTPLCGGSALVCIDPESGDEVHRYASCMSLH